MKNINESIDSCELYVNDNYEQYQDEVYMWRAVINQAFSDLSLPSSNRKYRLWRKQAVQWFIGGDKDFYTVCEYARVSPEEIIKHALKIILSRELI